jgi:hypothetical protein
VSPTLFGGVYPPQKLFDIISLVFFWDSTPQSDRLQNWPTIYNLTVKIDLLWPTAAVSFLETCKSVVLLGFFEDFMI